MTTSNNKKLLLLLDRPQEPVFGKKGTKSTAFDVPKDYLTDKYKNIQPSLTSRFGEADERIPVRKISVPPLKDILEIGRQENFSLFLPKHQRIADRLIRIFMGLRNVDDLLSVAVYARDRVNPYLFNYSLSVAILHRPDTRDLDIPAFVHYFPDKFINSEVFTDVRKETNTVPEGSRAPIEIPRDYTASDLEEEHRIAYFREDLGVNLHHWHWHLVYPGRGDRAVINKNRRGELFYYMHQQIIARYNFERLSNKLKRVERFIDWRSPIKEAYFPKLDSLVASRAYPARVANQKIRDVDREPDQIQIDVDNLFRWRDRVFAAIHEGSVMDTRGNKITLTENEGIDILGNLIENTDLSVNPTFYGNLHNMGHIFISYIHDPDNRHLETFGVMGDSATAMRDPIFYRWHAYIDDIFQEYKATLPRYTEEQLNYPGVAVTAVAVQGQGSNNGFNTFWQQSDVDLSRGMDFQERGSVFARFTHLQHQPFTYNISVTNNGAARRGTCRIWLAPKLDERGNPWLFRDQKNMFIEMDKFTVNLRQGQNTITRSSSESSVSIPFERTFRDLDTNRPADEDPNISTFNFCGCGWPQHMLVPKGAPEGLQCQLFVMISNYTDDAVEQTLDSGECNDSASYCGLKDKLYPDRRSMGYPFDRTARDGVDTLQQFLTPNMRVQDVSINFSDRTMAQGS